MTLINYKLSNRNSLFYCLKTYLNGGLFLFVVFSLLSLGYSNAQQQQMIYTGQLADSSCRKIFTSPQEIENEIEKLKLIPAESSDSDLYLAYRNIGVFYGVTNNNDSALKYLILSEKYATQNSLRKVIAIKNIAIVYRKQANYPLAIKTLEIALKLAVKYDIKIGIAAVYAEMATDFNELGNGSSSILYLLNAIKILSALNRPNDFELAVAKLNLGNTYVNKGKFDFARKLFIDGQKTFKMVGDMANYYLATMNLGICDAKQGKYAAAEAEFIEALNGSQEFQDYEVSAIIKQNLAQLYEVTKMPNKAMTLYKEILKYCIQNNSPNLFHQASCYTGFLNSNGYYYQVLAIQKQLARFDTIVRLDDKSAYYKELGFAYLNLGLKDSANQLFRLAFSYQDTFANTNESDIVNNSQAIYQSQIQEKEIKILEQGVIAQELAATKSVLFSIAFILLVGVLSIYFYYKYKLEKKNKDLIELSFKAEQSEKDALNNAIEKQQLQTKLQDEALNRQQLALNSKTNFVRNISHEIRTPLHAINGVTNLLLLDKFFSEGHKEQIEVLKTQTQLLLNLLNSVLDYDQIERGEIQFQHERFELGLILKELTDTYANEAKNKGIEFSAQLIPEVLGNYLSDGAKIKQVLQNLISNSIKFTEKGQIKLSIIRTETGKNNDTFQFKITDTGKGINIENKKQIFQAFEQADMSNLREKHGIGLGLTISNKLVEGLGGILKIDSIPNIGTSIFFDLILKRETVKDELEAKEKQEGSLIGKKALIVEDMEINAMLMKRYLKNIGCEFRHALNGQLAIEFLKEGDFDFVLMDLQMPVMDGITCTKEIRNLKNTELKNIPIIVISAADEDSIVKEALDAGVNSFVLKPFEFTELTKTILKEIKTGNA